MTTTSTRHFGTAAILLLIVGMMIPGVFAFKAPFLTPATGTTLSGSTRFNVTVELDAGILTTTYNITVVHTDGRVLCTNQSAAAVNNTNLSLSCLVNTLLEIENATTPAWFTNVTNSTNFVINGTLSRTYGIDNTNPNSVNFSFSANPLGNNGVTTASVGSEVTSCVICFGESCYTGSMGASQCTYTNTVGNPSDAFHLLKVILGDGIDSAIESVDANNLQVRVAASTAGVSSEVLDASNAAYLAQQQAGGSAAGGSSGSSNTFVMIGTIALLGYLIFIRK